MGGHLGRLVDGRRAHLARHPAEVLHIILELHQQGLEGLEDLVPLDVQQGQIPVIPKDQGVEQGDGGYAGLGDGGYNAKQGVVLAAAVDDGSLDELQGYRALKEGPHNDNIEGVHQQGNDQRGIVLAQSQHLAAHNVGGHQAAAENHGKEAEEVEEAPELKIGPVEHIGVQRAHEGA